MTKAAGPDATARTGGPRAIAGWVLAALFTAGALTVALGWSRRQERGIRARPFIEFIKDEIHSQRHDAFYDFSDRGPLHLPVLFVGCAALANLLLVVALRIVRPGAPEFEPVEGSPPASAVVAAAACWVLVDQLIARAVEGGLRWRLQAEESEWVYISQLLPLAPLAASAVVLAALGARTRIGRPTRRAFAAVLLLVPASLAVAVPEGYLWVDLDVPATPARAYLIAGAGWPTLWAPALLVAAICVEEWLLRGVFLDFLRPRLGAAASVAVVAVAGATLSHDPTSWAVAFYLGLVSALLRVRSGGILPGVMLRLCVATTIAVGSNR